MDTRTDIQDEIDLRGELSDQIIDLKSRAQRRYNRAIAVIVASGAPLGAAIIHIPHDPQIMHQLPTALATGRLDEAIPGFAKLVFVSITAGLGSGILSSHGVSLLKEGRKLERQATRLEVRISTLLTPSQQKP